MEEQLRLPCRCNYSCHATYYAGGDTAIVPWQASQIAGGARHFGVTDHTRWPNAAQQEPTTTVNSGAGTSTAGSSERTEDAFHQPADCHAANNFESESGMAIIPAMPTSTPLNTSTSNTRVDGTAADTEANDETDDDAQEDEDGGQSEIWIVRRSKGILPGIRKVPWICGQHRVP
ncbi:uncharacterized protein [Triticum aestivum]|uniref:uncharacterized protein n=1 Tax=Triticum aestivum TaxID=4565 RepID=UPI001D003605|nr:uncharacterized protein LOC123077922 [Triticum aestivum]